MTKEEMKNIKKVYVYNRLNREITECDVDEIDGCYFAHFKYNLEGSNRTTWHYDLRNGVIRHLDGSMITSIPHVLVSYDKRSLGWIKESDDYIYNHIRSQVFGKLNEIMLK